MSKLKPGFEEWLAMECEEYLTNKDFVDIFINRYLTWVSHKKTVVGLETRQLKINEYTAVHRRKIQRIIYDMSV